MKRSIFCSIWIILWIISIVSIRIISGVKCHYCNNDFVCVSRHQWRCKARVTSVSPSHLPHTTTQQWSEANAFFKYSFCNIINVPITNLDESVNDIQNRIYNYFASNYGTINRSNERETLSNKYKDFSPNQLKKSLRRLKLSADGSIPNTDEIRFVSSLLRNKLNKKLQSPDSTESLAHQFYSNF